MKFIYILFSLIISTSLLAKDKNQIEFEILAQSTTSWDGTPLPEYDSGTPEVTILKVVIPPGQRLAKHKHPAINAGVMLSGQITVQSEDGAVLILNAGDPIIELVDKWHSGKSTGTEPAVIIVFYAGIKGQPLSLKH
jgi:quercetin dioxygenase-like cupin family protein